MSLETCQNCQGCCSSVKIPFKKESEAGKKILEMWENNELPEGHELRDCVPTRPRYWLYDSHGEDCVFLKEETYECSIHDIKPILCRTYPLKWQNKKNYFIDTCPLTFVVPLKEIYSWRNGNEEEIGDMIYYVNSYKNPEIDMIPITRLIYESDSLKELFEEENNEKTRQTDN